jgi:hypothetical protein
MGRSGWRSEARLQARSFELDCRCRRMGERRRRAERGPLWVIPERLGTSKRATSHFVDPACRRGGRQKSNHPAAQRLSSIGTLSNASRDAHGEHAGLVAICDADYQPDAASKCYVFDVARARGSHQRSSRARARTRVHDGPFAAEQHSDRQRYSPLTDRLLARPSGDTRRTALESERVRLLRLPVSARPAFWRMSD